MVSLSAIRSGDVPKFAQPGLGRGEVLQGLGDPRQREVADWDTGEDTIAHQTIIVGGSLVTSTTEPTSRSVRAPATPEKIRSSQPKVVNRIVASVAALTLPMPDWARTMGRARSGHTPSKTGNRQGWWAPGRTGTGGEERRILRVSHRGCLSSSKLPPPRG